MKGAPFLCAILTLAHTQSNSVVLFIEDLGPPNLREQVLQGLFSFPSPYWDDVSQEAVDFIEDLLKQDPAERLTVDQALAHPWMALDVSAVPSFNTNINLFINHMGTKPIEVSLEL